MIDIYYYDGHLKKGSIQNISKLKNNKIWIDCNNITKEEIAILTKNFDIHPTTQEDIFNSSVRIKVEEFDNYLFCIFYGAKKNNKLLEMYELDFVLGKDFVISNHKKSLETYEELKKDKETLESLFKRGEDFLLHHLIDLEVDNYFPILEDLDDQIEGLEEEAATKPKPKVLSEILNVKRNIIIVKKKIFEQREKISFLAKKDYKFISRHSVPYFRDVYDDSIRVSDSLDNSRELIANTYDIYMSTLSNNMNEIIKVLSVIATLFLPLTVISSIYGTNFRLLPGADNPVGFWIMIVGMLSISAGFLIYFKRKRWF